MLLLLIPLFIFILEMEMKYFILFEFIFLTNLSFICTVVLFESYKYSLFHLFYYLFFLSFIGYGSSAIVYLAAYKPLHVDVCIKQIDLDQFERNQIDELRKEIR